MLGAIAALALVLGACGHSASGASEQSMGKASKAGAASASPTAEAEAEAAESEEHGADEVCDDMIRGALPKQLTHGTVQGPPTKVVDGADTTCTYKITGGSMRLSVHETDTHAQAVAYIAALRRKVAPVKVVTLLGEESFTATDGSTYTLKDQKVLTVDPTNLPQGNDRKQIAQALSFLILSCWTG